MYIVVIYRLYYAQILMSVKSILISVVWEHVVIMMMEHSMSDINECEEDLDICGQGGAMPSGTNNDNSLTCVGRWIDKYFAIQ